MSQVKPAMETQALAPRTADKLIADFDRAWQSGPPPQLDTFLRQLPEATAPEDDRLRRETVEELVRIDLEYRWRAAGSARLGQAALLDQYQGCLERWGPLSVDLIAWEYRVRHCWGDRPGHADYLQRFAQQGRELAEALRAVDAELASEFGRMTMIRQAPVPEPRPETAVVAVPAAEARALPAAVADLVELLRREEVLSAAQLSDLARDLQGTAAGPHELARDLIRRSWLTPYQVNLLLQGRLGELRLGPYLLLERLGEGAASQVFKARHLHMNRIVALKVIHKELLADDVVVSRFRREMRLVAQLQHPHIIHANDAGPLGGLHALVMEYADGIDLARLVKQSGPLAVPLACACVCQAAEGLRYIHERGLVHRDIKPSNLFVTVQTNGTATASNGPTALPAPVAGRPLIKILDLGLARLCCNMSDEANGRQLDGRSAETLTLAGSMMIMGTPDYLAPEQALDFHGADIRADIYSLGCTFFHLLTGRPPFEGGSVAQKLKRHQQEEPPAVRSLRPEVPEEVAQVLSRMLAKRPEERFQTPGALVAALAGATPHPGSIRRHGWRRRWVAPAAAALVALAAGCIFLLAAGRHNAATEAQRGEQLQALRDRAGRRPAGADRQLWQDILDFRMRQPGSPEALAAGALLSQTPSALDGMPGQAHEIVATLGNKDEKLHGLALSPDTRLAATIIEVNRERKVRLWDLTTQRERATFDGLPNGAFAPTFSPDGRLLAVAGTRGSLKLWSCATGKPLGPFKVKNHIRCLAFSPDGQTLALGTQGGEVQLWDLGVGGEGPTFRDHNRSIQSVTFSPDGRLLAAGCQDRPMKFWDVAAGKLLATADLPAASWLLFAPDNRTALLMPHGGKPQLWEAPAAKDTWNLKASLAVEGLTPLAFTADGTKLAYIGPRRSFGLSEVNSLAKIPADSWQLPGKGGTEGAVLAADMRHLALVESGSNFIIVRLSAR